MIMFALSEARPCCAATARWSARPPDKLTVMAGFLPGPAGEPVMLVCPFYSGSGPGLPGRRRIDRLRALGTPLQVDQIGRCTSRTLLRMFDGDGRRRTPPCCEPAVHAGAHRRHGGHARRRGPAGRLAVLRAGRAPLPRRGQPGPTPADTAFGLRTDHLMTKVIAEWAPGDEAARAASGPSGPRRHSPRTPLPVVTPTCSPRRRPTGSGSPTAQLGAAATPSAATTPLPAPRGARAPPCNAPGVATARGHGASEPAPDCRLGAPGVGSPPGATPTAHATASTIPSARGR